ncbi:MAG: hypothetical protein ACLFSQ_06950 [Candidatus Zixiibacteriota bacterium]
MKRTILITILIVISSILYSADNIYSSAYLMQPLSSELDAIGGVSNSLPLGILASGQNPAIEDSSGQFSFALSQAFGIQDTRQNAIAAGINHGIWESRIYGFYGAVEDIQARSKPTEEPDYLFTARQMFLGLNLNAEVSEYLTAGAGMKIINETIDLDEMNAIAYDFGVVGKFYGFNLGLSVRNLGKTVKFREILYELPLTYSAGLSRNWRFITAELYYNKPDLLAADYGIGTQFDINKWLTLRSGIRLNHDSRLFSAGATFNYEGFSLSYGFAPFKNDLGVRHSIGLSYGIIN